MSEANVRELTYGQAVKNRVLNSAFSPLKKGSNILSLIFRNLLTIIFYINREVVIIFNKTEDHINLGLGIFNCIY